MIAARLAGIRVFATGGIGGVHRGAELSFDISADLDELARTRVTVVAAGAKAIGLFSGSREKEVKRILPVMLQAASLLKKEIPETVFFISKSPNVRPAATASSTLKLGTPRGVGTPWNPRRQFMGSTST